MFNLLFWKRPKPLTPQKREELLAKIAEVLEHPLRYNAAADLGDALYDYARQENDPAQYKDILGSTLDLFTEAQGANRVPALDALFESLCEYRSPNVLATVEKLLSYIPALKNEAQLGGLDKALNRVGRLAHKSAGLRKFIFAHIDQALEGFTPDQAVTVLSALRGKGWDNDKSRHNDFMAGKIIERLEGLSLKTVVAGETKQSHLYSAITTGLRHSAARVKARDILLPVIAAETDANKVFDFIDKSYVHIYPWYWTSASYYGADKKLEAAAFEKWQELTGRMNAADRLAAAEYAVYDQRKSDYRAGKTMKAAVDIVIASAQEFAAGNSYPAKTLYALDVIVRHKLKDYRTAKKLRADFNAAQAAASPPPPQAPRISPTEFKAAFETQALKKQRQLALEKREAEEAAILSQHLATGMPLETPVKTLRPVQPKIRKPRNGARHV